MKSFNKIFLKNTGTPLFWIMLGLLFKGIPFFGVLLNKPICEVPGFWGATQPDFESYLLPIDNLLKYGAYAPDFRMPGYGFVYLLFRFVCSKALACNLLILTQYLLASVSVYYLALIAKNLFKSDKYFYVTFYLFLICPFSNFYDAYICTESLCTSILIFSVYFYTCYFQNSKAKYLFYCGLLLTWVIFMRPVFICILPVLCIPLFLHNGNLLASKIKYAFILLVPFIIIDGAWILRNFNYRGKLQPLTSSLFYPSISKTYLLPLFQFTQSWGGASSFNNKPADINWFNYYYKGMTGPLPYDSLPDYIYTSAYNKDSLLHIKHLITELQKPSIDSLTSLSYQNTLRVKLLAYRRAFRSEKTFVYFIEAPLKISVALLFGPTAKEFLKRGKSVPFLGKFIVGINALSYLLIILTGFAGILLLLVKGWKESLILWVIPFIPMYDIFIHCFVFRFSDTRYFIPSWPFMIICSAYASVWLYQKLIKSKP